ncbi:MAG TPA: serine/threonine-protein kinase, partial [Kofleriaceae bacterium]|nr:serine/threonine-protein kinase [Kofleriaceae bacterium]
MTDREDLSGRTLGEFIVRERIGSGGFGDVYRCEQPLLGRQAVIKVLHQRLRYNDVVLQRFLREAQLASRLDHPYAAHVYAFGIERDDGLFWIAMEMVQGTTLARWLRERGPLPLDQLVPFFELVAEVVQTAHDRGIVHRDLKPSNVMVIERAGRLLPKLLDFGIAKLLDEAAAAEPLTVPPSLLDAAALSLARTRPSASGAESAAAGREPSHTGTTPSHKVEARSSEASSQFDGTTPRSGPTSVSAETPAGSLTRTATPSSALRDNDRRQITRVGVPLGSPPYMSPEQWTDAVTVGPSADLYALGVMAYEALTGRRPFDAATAAGYVELHRNAAVPTLGVGFPPALDRLFRRALAKHPDDRWASALELAAAFRAASGLSATTADLPRLDDTISDAWLAGAPQPLAESIAVLDGARNAHQARDAIHDLTRGLVRYLLAIAFATRAHVRDETSDPELVDLVRTMPQRDLTDDDRVRLLRLLVRPLTRRRGAHPIPELVDLVTPHADDGADGLDGLLALLAATSHAGTDDAVRDRLARVLPDLAHILRRTAFLLDYLLVVPRDQTPERWTGLRRPQRAVATLRNWAPL